MAPPLAVNQSTDYHGRCQRDGINLLEYLMSETTIDSPSPHGEDPSAARPHSGEREAGARGSARARHATGPSSRRGDELYASLEAMLHDLRTETPSPPRAPAHRPLKAVPQYPRPQRAAPGIQMNAMLSALLEVVANTEGATAIQPLKLDLAPTTTSPPLHVVPPAPLEVVAPLEDIAAPHTLPDVPPEVHHTPFLVATTVIDDPPAHSAIPPSIAAHVAPAHTLPAPPPPRRLDPRHRAVTTLGMPRRIGGGSDGVAMPEVGSATSSVSSTLPVISLGKQRALSVHSSSVVTAPAPRAAPSTALHIRGAAIYALNVVLGAILVLASLGAAGTAVGLATGHTAAMIITGSMAPRIPIGALVVTKTVPVSSLKAGDVLAFPRPDQPQDTYYHRIYHAHSSAGELVIQTKGDANLTPDPWILTRPLNASANLVEWAIPGAGTLLQILLRIAIMAAMALVIGGVYIRAFHKLWPTTMAPA